MSVSRHPSILAAWLAAMLVLASGAGAQADLPIHNRKLANGLEVIVIENHAVPIVTVELDVKNGAFTEPPEYDGLSHLYEHMFFKANRAIPNQERYLERLRELGAAWNGTTSTERVNYYVTVGVDSVRAALQFMEDAIRFPLFKQEELVRERPVVLGEYDRAESNPFFDLGRGVDTLLWTSAYYSRKNVIGNRQVLATTPPEKMHAIQQRYYVPNNTALILSGDIAPEYGFQLAEQVFGDWSRGGDPFAEPVPAPPPLTRSRAVIVERPVNSVTLSVAWHGPSVDEDTAATYAADVLSTVINNPTSRFHKRMVESGLAFQANVGYFTQHNVGPINAFLQTSPEKLLEAKRALLEEIAKFTDESYITDAELEAARNQLGIQALYERERSESFAHTVGFWWAVAGLDYYRSYVPKMQAVTKADITRYARTYLRGRPFVIGVLINPQARAQLELTPEMLLTQEVVP